MAVDPQTSHTSEAAASRDGHAPRPGGPGTLRGMLSVDELKAEIEAGTIDTIVTAFTDMQGRLIGKRIQGEYFVEDVLDHGIEGCNYLLALDMEMDPVPGYDMANWERGYGDFTIVPDMATLRRIPWLEGTAMVLCDVAWEDGSPVVASPRQILIEQYERAHAMGFAPLMASELEFYLYRESYEEAAEKEYRDLTPTIPYILDYHVLATTRDEDFMRQVRRGMQAGGLPLGVSEGGGWDGPPRVEPGYARGITPARPPPNHKNGGEGNAPPQRDHLGRPPHHLQERREGDRAPQRDLGDLHGQAVGEGHRQLVPHPLEPRLTRHRQQRLLRGRRGDRRVPALPGRAARAHQG